MKYNLIHPTKTGGIAILSNILRESKKLDFIQHVLIHEDVCLDNPDIINVITLRDPLDRFISTFNYWKYGSCKWSGKNSERRDATIHDFIKGISENNLPLDGYYWDAHYCPQQRWLKNIFNNTIAIIYRKDFNAVLDKLNEVFYMNLDSVPRINVTSKKDNLSTEDLAIVKKFVKTYYKEDYEIFERLNEFMIVI